MDLKAGYTVVAVPPLKEEWLMPDDLATDLAGFLAQNREGNPWLNWYNARPEEVKSLIERISQERDELPDIL